MLRNATQRKRLSIVLWKYNKPTFLCALRACLHGGGGPQVGEVTCLDGVTRLSIKSLILMWSRLHVRWGDPPHVTSRTWGPPPSCKQALKFVCRRPDFPNKSLSEENDIFYKGYHHKEYHAACICWERLTSSHHPAGKNASILSRQQVEITLLCYRSLYWPYN